MNLKLIGGTLETFKAPQTMNNRPSKHANLNGPGYFTENNQDGGRVLCNCHSREFLSLSSLWKFALSLFFCLTKHDVPSLSLAHQGNAIPY